MNLLEKTRKLNMTLQLSGNGVLSFEELCSILRDILKCNVYIADTEGKFLGYAYLPEEQCDRNMETIEDKKFPKEYNNYLTSLKESKANQYEENPKCAYFDEMLCAMKERYVSIVPINGGGKRLGTMVLAKNKFSFTDEDLVLSEYSATIVAMELMRLENIAIVDKERKNNNLKLTISTLSYTEIQAIKSVFESFGENRYEGMVIVSKIASSTGITHSVIVNALRKLESGRVIETRSLGMKGTYIKVVNKELIELLKYY
jgi:transcriptional pleiotropic repressor